MGRKDHAIEVSDLIKKEHLSIVAEVGVWKSDFLKYVLRSSSSSFPREYWAVDRWDILDESHGRMALLTKEDWDNLYLYACSCMYWFSPLKVLRMDSHVASKLFPNNYFDLVFIDGSHYYEEIKRDIECWLPKVKKNGYICGHDYRNIRDKGVEKAVLEFFPQGIRRGKGSTWFKQI